MEQVGRAGELGALTRGGVLQGGQLAPCRVPRTYLLPVSRGTDPVRRRAAPRLRRLERRQNVSWGERA